MGQTPNITSLHGVLVNGVLEMTGCKNQLLLLQYKGNGHMNWKNFVSLLFTMLETNFFLNQYLNNAWKVTLWYRKPHNHHGPCILNNVIAVCQG